MSATNLPSAMDVDEAAIDEGLYSRQLHVLELCATRSSTYNFPLDTCLGTKVSFKDRM